MTRLTEIDAQIANLQAERAALLRVPLNPVHMRDNKSFYAAIHGVTVGDDGEWVAAMQTMLLLAAQPGVVQAEDGVVQWVISFTNDEPRSEWFSGIGSKLMTGSPCFPRRQECDAALAAVGPENILKMRNTMIWRKE